MTLIELKDRDLPPRRAIDRQRLKEGQEELQHLRDMNESLQASLKQWKESARYHSGEVEHWKGEHRKALLEVQRLREENERLLNVLKAVSKWEICWAEGLDANVERIKTMVDAALEDKP